MPWHGNQELDRHVEFINRFAFSRDEDPDPVGSVDFGPPDPDPLIFGPPDPDPTCDNGLIKLFSF